jgi:D-3-phosphoglycerate dehydrogenase
MDETKDYVNADLLKETKEGLRLLNFARGGLVNYDALENAIEEGTIATYITDFPNERLLKMKNVINIPHLGASTPESEENCAEMAIHSLKEYLENGNIINSVNYPDCNMGVCEADNRITVNHANVPNMLGQITKILADNDINISVMTNKNRGSWAYTMIDVDSNVGEDVKTALKSIKGVTRVRIIK